MTRSEWDLVEEAAAAIAARDARKPEWLLVLGSGLGSYADTLEKATSIPYQEIPHFPSSTVSGHSGELVIGEVDGLCVAVMRGRVHLYEGYPIQDVVRPLRTLWRCGATRLLITNSAGGVRADLAAGDLVLLSDHLNLTGMNPLTGANDERFGPRFPDMSAAYDPALREVARSVAKDQGLALQEGVYAGLFGPNYETPAEVRMVGRLGGDLVGMSTVCEVIAAAHIGMRVLGISCVSNLAAGISETPLAHEEVQETASQVRGLFQALVDGILRWQAP